MEYLKSAEVIATIIGLILGVILTGLANWWRQRRGNWVVINQISQSPQITISQEVRENLKITYEDKPADQLVLSTFRMTNTSPDNLEDIHIKMTISFKSRALGLDPNSFVELEYYDPLDKIEIERIDSSSEELSGKRIYNIYRPFLNSERKYKEERIELTVFSSSEIETSVEGGGSGWYTKFSDSSKGLLDERVIAGAALLIGAVVVLIVDISRALELRLFFVLLGSISMLAMLYFAFRMLPPR